MTTIASKYRGTKKFLLVYMKLISTAQHRDVVYYAQIAKILGIEQPGHHMARELGQILGKISEDEHQSGRPMLSAVAVATSGSPGEGFFTLAARLGKYSGASKSEEKVFRTSERDRVYDIWAGS